MLQLVWFYFIFLIYADRRILLDMQSSRKRHPLKEVKTHLQLFVIASSSSSSSSSYHFFWVANQLRTDPRPTIPTPNQKEGTGSTESHKQVNRVEKMGVK